MSRASSLEDLGDAVCPCVDHFGKLLMDTVFPLSVSELYHMIFHDPHWTKKFNQILKNTGYEVSAWAKDKDGIEGRTCTYTMELNHAMAPKNCVVTEKQTIQTVEEHVVVINKVSTPPEDFPGGGGGLTVASDISRAKVSVTGPIEQIFEEFYSNPPTSESKIN